MSRPRFPTHRHLSRKRKTVDNTVSRPGLVPFKPGHDPRRGHGVKGRSGRKPNWLREFCDDLLASPKTKAQVRDILADKSHPAFATMWKAVSDRAHGKPEQPLEHSGTIVIREKREPRVLIADN
jgi:hypothetical protein